MNEAAQAERFRRFLLVLRQALLLIVAWIERETNVRGTAKQRYQNDLSNGSDREIPYQGEPFPPGT